MPCSPYARTIRLARKPALRQWERTHSPLHARTERIASTLLLTRALALFAQYATLCLRPLFHSPLLHRSPPRATLLK
eukprot:5926746-Pleurochrysis_carterae.AAC.1